MKGILIQQKVFKAISGAYPDNASEEKIVEDDEIAYSSIILNLSDIVIRKVGTQNSAKELWEKLEELYTETSLPTKLFLLEKFFKYKLDLSKNIDENIDEFTKLIQDIKLTGDKSIDDYSPIVLLNVIPDTYNDVKSAIKYGRDSVNLETVINGLKSKEIDLKTNKPSQSSNEVNMVRGRNINRNSGYKFRRHSRTGVGVEAEAILGLSTKMTKIGMRIKKKKRTEMIGDVTTVGEEDILLKSAKSLKEKP
ncbi:UNVERIFIED_CONTAM: hypothetical protein Sradi_0647500 [Sesamum radiatum]|uniref:UBN2 domain-containing protein n=1 Tax=Sesamum radiatum TaxID=300843 RepID=A0AAW2VQ81_SESRA